MTTLQSDALPAAAMPSQPEGETVHALFFVTADADPGMVPRLVEPFAKLGIVPARVHISGEYGSGGEFSADLRASGVSRQDAHLIDKALARIVGVRRVIAVTR